MRYWKAAFDALLSTHVDDQGACVCVWKWEKECVWVSEWVRVCLRKRGAIAQKRNSATVEPRKLEECPPVRNVRVCVSAWKREREKERERETGPFPFFSSSSVSSSQAKCSWDCWCIKLADATTATTTTATAATAKNCNYFFSLSC